MTKCYILSKQKGDLEGLNLAPHNHFPNSLTNIAQVVCIMHGKDFLYIPMTYLNLIFFKTKS